MSQTPLHWRTASGRFEFPGPVRIMGILNVTPDSFSDGGRHADLDRAVAAGEEMVRHGADLLDIGGESTRPGAAPVSEEEECRRVLPVLQELKRRVRVPLSVDTMKPGVAGKALEAGAAIINDVAANRSDSAMWKVVAAHGAGYVAMHMQGAPATMQANPTYQDVTAEVAAFFQERLRRLEAAGVDPDQVVVDVGIGFGKRLVHNLKLLSCLDRFKTIGRPLLLGASRKSFIGEITGVADPSGRDAGSLACAVLAVQAGVQLLRVHNVELTRQAVRMAEAILAMGH